MRNAARIALPLTVAAVLLTGCTSNPVGESAQARTAPATQSPAPKPTPATPPPTQDAHDATPVEIACKKLTPAIVAHELNADMKLEKDWTPGGDSPASAIPGLHGTACLWKDAVGDTLEVAVAKPSKTDALALKNDLVTRSNSVPTYGGEAYFQVVDHQGVVDAFRGRTWIVARSNLFYEPGDAADVVAAALAGLGLGPRVVSPSAAASAAVSASATPTPSSTPAG